MRKAFPGTNRLSSKPLVLDFDRGGFHADVAGRILQALAEGGDHQGLLHGKIVKPGEHLLGMPGPGEISSHAISSRQPLERKRVVAVLFQMRNGLFVFLFIR